MSPPVSVGLTGGIASGKSSVAQLLAARGAVVIDADSIARQVLAPNTSGLAEVVEYFGQRILDGQGALDRAALGRIVFKDEESRQRLNSIVHPRVREISTQMRQGLAADAIVVEDIPLLVETAQQGRFDVVVVVEAPENERIARMVDHRGMSQDEARSRIAAQATDAQRAEVADIVIKNDGSLDDLEQDVDALHARLKRMQAV